MSDESVRRHVRTHLGGAVVTDPVDIVRFEAALTPVGGQGVDTVISIHPRIITRFRLVEAG